MPITRDIKDALNARLHDEILGLRTSPPDYTASPAAIQPVLDRLAVDGWSVSPAAWDGAARVLLQRSMVLTITRSPEHQARVLTFPIGKGGGVPPDDPGTYERAHTTLIHYVLGESSTIGGALVVLDESPALMAIATLSATAKGPRPANWIRDL